MTCKYPCCEKVATRDFALVPLCQEHYSEVLSETVTFYASKNQHTYEERNYYLNISKFIPWRRRNDTSMTKPIKLNVVKSGLKGVTFHETSKKWQATLYVGQIDGKKIRKYLGLFDEKEDAAKALELAKTGVML